MSEPLARTPVGVLHRGQHFHYIGRWKKGWLYARSVSADGRLVHAFRSKDPNGHRSIRTIDVNTIDSITEEYLDDDPDTRMDDRRRERRSGAATTSR